MLKVVGGEAGAEKMAKEDSGPASRVQGVRTLATQCARSALR